MALTSKQMDFVKYYCETVNGKESALRAGYKASNATDTARKLLSRDDIQEAIRDYSKQALANNDIDNDKLIKELKAIAESNITDFVNIVKEIEEFEDFDEDGNTVVKKYETAELEYNETKKLSETQQKCIQSITKTKNGISVSLYDKTKAIDMLCRLGGMYDTEDDNKSITVKIEGNAEDYAN